MKSLSDAASRGLRWTNARSFDSGRAPGRRTGSTIGSGISFSRRPFGERLSLDAPSSRCGRGRDRDWRRHQRELAGGSANRSRPRMRDLCQGGTRSSPPRRCQLVRAPKIFPPRAIAAGRVHSITGTAPRWGSWSPMRSAAMAPGACVPLRISWALSPVVGTFVSVSRSCRPPGCKAGGTEWSVWWDRPEFLCCLKAVVPTGDRRFASSSSGSPQRDGATRRCLSTRRCVRSASTC